MLLHSSGRLYNRIYCGAACPEAYSDQIKKLITVGGILVVPVNDQLLQIRRIDMNSWVVKSVLPVSFAGLVVPPQEISDDGTAFPSVDPEHLQDLCRTKIRSILLQRVKLDHPELWLRNRKHPRDTKRSLAVGRCLVPLFANLDSDNDSETDLAQDSLEESSSSSSFTDDSSNNGQLARAESDRRAGIRLAENLTDDEDENGIKIKREKIDDNVDNDLFNAGNETHSPSVSNQTIENSESSAGSSSSRALVENDQCSRESRETQLSSHQDANRTRLQERASLVIFESHSDEGTLSDSSEESQPAACSNEKDNDNEISPLENYSFYMKQSLMELPLPLVLKSFLNYGRGF